MIEAFLRQLKHSWLYLNTLDKFTALGRLIEFYVTAHNEIVPHAAFDGQTPDEMYFGTGDAVIERLAALRTAAREERTKANREARCNVCAGESKLEALQVQRLKSQML